MTSIARTVSLNFVVQGVALLDEWLEKHKAKFETCLMSVNSAMIDNVSLDLIMKITPERTRVLRISMRLRHDLHSIVLRMGSYEVNPTKTPKPKITLMNVLGKADYVNTWHFPQSTLSDVDEDNRVGRLLKTVTGNLQLFLFDPYPSPLVESLQ